MNVYLSSRGCPKCGGHGTEDTYYPESTYIPSAGIYEPIVHPERIRRCCRRCVYAWNEAPVDAVEGSA